MMTHTTIQTLVDFRNGLSDHQRSWLKSIAKKPEWHKLLSAIIKDEYKRRGEEPMQLDEHNKYVAKAQAFILEM